MVAVVEGILEAEERLLKGLLVALDLRRPPAAPFGLVQLVQPPAALTFVELSSVVTGEDVHRETGGFVFIYAVRPYRPIASGSQAIAGLVDGHVGRFTMGKAVDAAESLDERLQRRPGGE